MPSWIIPLGLVVLGIVLGLFHPFLILFFSAAAFGSQCAFVAGIPSRCMLMPTVLNLLIFFIPTALVIVLGFGVKKALDAYSTKDATLLALVFIAIFVLASFASIALQLP